MDQLRLRVVELRQAFARWVAAHSRTRPDEVTKADIPSDEMANEIRDTYVLLADAYQRVLAHYEAEGLDVSEIGSYPDELLELIESYLDLVAVDVTARDDGASPSLAIDDIKAMTTKMITGVWNTEPKYMAIVATLSDSPLPGEEFAPVLMGSEGSDMGEKSLDREAEEGAQINDGPLYDPDDKDYALDWDYSGVPTAPPDPCGIWIELIDQSEASPVPTMNLAPGENQLSVDMTASKARKLSLPMMVKKLFKQGE